jgi:RHS repeat-associated protein
MLRYAGYAYDWESGLYYCSARYYDPATRQWTTADSAKADGEESAYQYCAGEPVAASDPSGYRYISVIAANNCTSLGTMYVKWHWYYDGRHVWGAGVEYAYCTRNWKAWLGGWSWSSPSVFAGWYNPSHTHYYQYVYSTIHTGIWKWQLVRGCWTRADLNYAGGAWISEW